MSKIGILGCQSTTDEMNCVMVGCFGNVRSRQGTFAEYAEDDPLELMGLVNCGGCPTAVGSDRIWQKVKALVDFGIESLHLTSCLVHLCPFKASFVDRITKDFPHLKIVEGTHPFLDLEAFKTGIRELLCQRAVTPQTMNDLVFKRIKISTDTK